MPTTTTVEFDREMYAPGDTIAMSVTVQTDDQAPQQRTIAGSILLDGGTTVEFSGTFAVVRGAPQIVEAAITSGGGIQWDPTPSIDPHRVVFTGIV